MNERLTAQHWADITPSDTVNIPGGPPRAIYVGGAGNIAAVGSNGNVVVFTAVPAGSILPIAPVRINSTSTTATQIEALY